MHHEVPTPATPALTRGLELSVDEGEQLLGDAAVGNGPGQEAVVGPGCFQKEIRIRWEVWCLDGERGLAERELPDTPQQTLLLSGMFHRRHSVPGSSMSRDRGRKNRKLSAGRELHMGRMVPGGHAFTPHKTQHVRVPLCKAVTRGGGVSLMVPLLLVIWGMVFSG